jgi:hypothetical protein
MRTALLVVLLGMVVCVSGCIVPSVHPFYTEKDVVFDPALVGSWEEQPGQGEQAAGKPPPVWTFSKHAEAAAEKPVSYDLKITERDRWVAFSVHLIKLEKTQFLDFYPQEASPELFGGTSGSDSEEGDDEPECVGFYLLHFMPAHSVARVCLSGDELSVASLNDNWVATQAREKTLNLPHEREDSLILTASPEELRSFLVAQGSNDKAFPNPLVLKRQKPAASEQKKSP